MLFLPESSGSNIPPTHLNIVLDIDATLVNTQKSYRRLEQIDPFNQNQCIELRTRIYNLELLDLGRKKGSGQHHLFWGTERPHLQSFLSFCNSYFNHVIIWSAGTRPYVEEVINHIYRYNKRPELILAQENCVIEDGYYIKPLKKVYELVPEMNVQNTLVLDDNYRTFSTQNLDNAIHIPPYEPKAQHKELCADDPTLLELQNWLLNPIVYNAVDIRQLNKNQIFSRPANFRY